METFKRLRLLATLFSSFSSLPLHASENTGVSRFISLQDIEGEMLEQSIELKAKGFEIAGAREKREALPSNYIPRISLEANYKYLSEIPEINMAPGRTLKFGDNSNYSIGPTLSMTLFDFNTKSRQQAALDKNLSSKENEKKNLESSFLYKTRFHYLNLVFLLEKRNLISESLKVAIKQLNDVSAKKRFGAGSRLDLITAQKEVHELESQYKELEFEITKEQSALFDVSYSARIKEAKQKTIELEKLQDLKKRFERYQNALIESKTNSKVKSLTDQSESLASQAQSISNQRYPKIQFFARSSYDYPNGPKLEQFNQNTVGLSLSMPLFDGGEIKHSIAEKSYQAKALKELALNEERHITEANTLMHARIENLNEQQEIIQHKVNEADEIADLVYKSYLEGRSTFIEVERANFKSRETKLNMSSNQYQIILNLLQLAALAGE